MNRHTCHVLFCTLLYAPPAQVLCDLTVKWAALTLNGMWLQSRTGEESWRERWDSWGLWQVDRMKTAGRQREVWAEGMYKQGWENQSQRCEGADMRRNDGLTKPFGFMIWPWRVIKIAGRNINNLRYADDTTLMAESEEELKSLLKVKEESEKVV